jgi:tRNA threonylcarbamoyladenosine biosynthesis protein TsaE
LKEKTLTIKTPSDQDTIRLGLEIGRLLVEGDVVGLVGELGSGKTWLTKGIALGLEVASSTVVTSPSFTLVNQYQGRAMLSHMDVYRLGSLDEALSAGIEETLNCGGVVVLEWADRWPEILPEQTLMVHLLIVDDHTRTVTLSARHPRSIEILAGLERAISRP